MSKLVSMLMMRKSGGTLNATVVGNPTITDDFIVSGFSQENTQSLNGNYLIIPTTQDYNSNWEFATKIKISALTSNITTITKINDNFSLQLNKNGKIYSYYSDGFSLSLNTWTWVICSQENGLRISTDGVNYSTSVEIPNSIIFVKEQPLGRGIRNVKYNESAFVYGEIDMKETYLKVNNEIVWQGVI